MRFLNAILQPSMWDKKILCFRSQSYPYNFFSKLFRVLVDRKVLPIHPTFLIESDPKQIEAALNHSFLGFKQIYWLGELATGDKATRGFLKSLSNYKGQHAVIFFASSEAELALDKKSIIELESRVDRKGFTELYKFFGKEFSAKKKLADSIFLRNQTVSIDDATRLIDCLELVGPQLFDEFKSYAALMLDQESSLFTLSGHFFSRNASEFFKVWSRVGKTYPEIFWISFWSDQLWRACNTVKFLSSGNHVFAKRASYRLPFTFIRTHWKDFESSELSAAHRFIYKADYALKKGSGFPFLDLFYLKHFQRGFS